MHAIILIKTEILSTSERLQVDFVFMNSENNLLFLSPPLQTFVTPDENASKVPHARLVVNIRVDNNNVIKFD